MSNNFNLPGAGHPYANSGKFTDSSELFDSAKNDPFSNMAVGQNALSADVDDLIAEALGFPVISGPVIPVNRNLIPTAEFPVYPTFFPLASQPSDETDLMIENFLAEVEDSLQRQEQLKQCLSRGDFNAAKSLIHQLHAELVALPAVLTDLVENDAYASISHFITAFRSCAEEDAHLSVLQTETEVHSLLQTSTQTGGIPLILLARSEEMLAALRQAGANTECLSGPGFFSWLSAMVSQGDLGLTEHLVTLKRGPLRKEENVVFDHQLESLLWDTIGKNGFTLLGDAISSKQPQMVELLLRLGAPCKGFVTENGYSPLVGAKINIWYSRTHGTSVEDGPAIQKIIEIVEKHDDGWNTEHHYRKLLAHYFSLSGKTSIDGYQFPLQGYWRELQVHEQCLRAIDTYLALAVGNWDDNNPVWNRLAAHLSPGELLLLLKHSKRIREEFSRIPALLANSFAYLRNPSIITELKLGQPLALAGGWAGHAIGGVITPIPYENGTAYEILFCNKGEYCSLWGQRAPGVQRMITDLNGALEVVGHWDHQAETLSKSLGQEEQELYEYIENAESDFRSLLPDQVLADKAFEEQGILIAWGSHLQNMSAPCPFYFDEKAVIAQKAQKVGNCSWANVLSMEMAINYVLLRSIIDSPEHPNLSKKVAKVLKDIRREDQRAATLRDYLQFHMNPPEGHPPMDPQLLKAILDATQHPNLEGILTQQVRAKAAELLAQLEKTTPSTTSIQDLASQLCELYSEDDEPGLEALLHEIGMELDRETEVDEELF